MSLFQLLHLTNKVVTTKKRLKYLIDTAAALNYLHGLSPKIVHRDIKSLNCLLHEESGGSIKVCDFGLVSTRKKEAGTPAYMAPELLEDYKTYSTPVDVYAFAMLCWETLCRKIPYEGLDAPSIRKHTLRSKRPEIPTLDFPEDCADLIRECWHARAARRPDMKEVHRRSLQMTALQIAIPPKSHAGSLLDASQSSKDTPASKQSPVRESCDQVGCQRSLPSSHAHLNK